MEIRAFLPKDRDRLHSTLIEARVFTREEINVAMELIDIVMKDEKQKDYKIHCMVDGQDQPVGYICYGPTPMTEGTFDLYWIVVNPNFQGQGIGSNLLNFLEKVLKGMGGRMILAETSSITEYEETQRFYLQRGFQEVGRVPDYYYPGNDRITYCKKL
jgi:ribosomal protein S18 acetylase RimI-like enzyme